MRPTVGKGQYALLFVRPSVRPSVAYIIREAKGVQATGRVLIKTTLNSNILRQDLTRDIVV